MTNPFNDSTPRRDGTNPEFATITTQGDHSLSLADVDADGKQELVYGSATIDDDGSLLYSSFDVLPPAAPPGATVRLGHGDAMHVTDIDPSRPGLEIWTAHEGATVAPYGSAMRDAATGEVLFGAYSGRDTGRGMIGDMRPRCPASRSGRACPARRASGTVIPGGDAGHEHVDPLVGRPHHAGRERQRQPDDDDRRLDAGRVLTATSTRTNNGTKGNPRSSPTCSATGARSCSCARPTRARCASTRDRADDAQADDAHARRAVPARRPPASRPPTTSRRTPRSTRERLDWSKVPVLTTPATPGEPTFKDRPGTSRTRCRCRRTSPASRTT
jgi:hypothetical protein